MFLCVIFTVLFVGYVVYGFIGRCVFEWPIRWDMATCWSEQVNASSQKAAENSAEFLPGPKVRIPKGI